jgi:hypothetical protein
MSELGRVNVPTSSVSRLSNCASYSDLLALFLVTYSTIANTWVHNNYAIHIEI